MRVARKDLEKMTLELNIKLGRPKVATSTVDGAIRWNEGHIHLDSYNGYALREVTGQKGGQAFYWPRWTRVSAKEMCAFLEGRLFEEEDTQ